MALVFLLIKDPFTVTFPDGVKAIVSLPNVMMNLKSRLRFILKFGERLYSMTSKIRRLVSSISLSLSMS